MDARYRILPLGPDDLNAVMALVELEGWEGYSTYDLLLISAVSPRGCFKLVCGQKLVGAIFALSVAGVTYLSFFIIDQAHRSLALARALSHHCLASMGRETRLYVTYANRRAVSAYSRAGFCSLRWITRYHIELSPAARGNKVSESVVEVGSQDVADLDRSCYRVNRRVLLERLSIYVDSRFYGYREKNFQKLSGFAFVRECAGKTLIGPLVAVAPHIAVEILKTILIKAPSAATLIELNNPTLITASQDIALFRQTEVSVCKMYRGSVALLENDRLVYGVGGHHFS